MLMAGGLAAPALLTGCTVGYSQGYHRRDWDDTEVTFYVHNG